MVEGVHFLGPFFGRAYRVTRASDPPVSCAVLRSRDVFIFVIRGIRNGVVSYAAQNKSPAFFWSGRYGVARATGSDQVVKMGVYHNIIITSP